MVPGRILTLVGAGGVGKTRLALELGLCAADDWPDGVWLLDLSPLTDGGSLISALGAATGAPAAEGVDPWGEVIAHLEGSRALIILDSCEHLVAECAQVAHVIVDRCPGCAVLATSRERLGCQREQVWRVQPLQVPPLTTVTASDALASPAVQLFAQRARSVQHGFVLDDASASSVVAICQRLDGLPLAIELAAARLAASSPADILRGLNDRFRLLRSHDPSRPERQRTMEALLEWSDRLLDDAERRCLRRLGVFGGSLSLEAAMAAVADEGIDQEDVPELVWSLVDKSLLGVDSTANETRYRMLDSIRDFSVRRLAEHKETSTVAARLALWYLDRIGPTHRHAQGWTSAVGVELDNVRNLVALVGISDQAQAQELAFTVGAYFDAVQQYRDGISELSRHLHALPEPTPARAALVALLAFTNLRVGNVDTARREIDAAARLQEEVGQLPVWYDDGIERAKGDMYLRTGQYEAAATVSRSALARPLSLRGQASMWSQLGISAASMGELEGAQYAFERELSAVEQLDDEVNQATAEGNLAESSLRQGLIATAARYQIAALNHAMELGSPVMVAFGLILAAHIASRAAEWEDATKLHAKAEELLGATSIVLYDVDREASERLMGEARLQLGEPVFVSACTAGQSWDTPTAAQAAEDVLRAVATQP
jgi:predicted ATPase